MIEIGAVTESCPDTIIVRICKNDIFENNKANIKIGKYLVIQEGNHNHILSVIENIKTLDSDIINYIIYVQPIGSYKYSDDNGRLIFKQGSVNLPSPTEPAFIPDKDVIEKIFSENAEYSYYIGKLSNNDEIQFYSDGNKFFSKHIAIVGSTGSGKSCTVAKLLQEIVGIKDNENLNRNLQKNTHIIIFDIHSEYEAAFKLDNNQKFNVNNLNVEKMHIPYWLMNSEELESIFIESSEMNSHNQISQFKRAVILSKQKHNPDKKVTYDMPVYFDIEEVYNFIYNLNNEVIGKKEGENKPKLLDKTLVKDITRYLNQKFEFIPQSTAKAEKASNGPFYGEFERFLTRLETKINDRRLDFIMKSTKEDGTLFKTDDFQMILKQFIGYIDKANITIIDLSGIPFEVLSITVSLVARLIFDFAFHYSRMRHKLDKANDIPFMIVCEEAHNYIPQLGTAEYKASKKSIERIAKEGRKYGLSLMVVSQRPSEVSDTIFSQCNNFISLRLTNINDQNCVKRLLPDNSSSLVNSLPTLSAGEALIVGDAVPIPAIIKMELPNPLPKSDSVKFYDEWKKSWIDVIFEDIIRRWRKE